MKPSKHKVPPRKDKSSPPYYSAGVFLIFEWEGIECTLLIKEGNSLSDPGGKIDPIDNENPTATALRELYEEAMVYLPAGMLDKSPAFDLYAHGRLTHKTYQCRVSSELILTGDAFDDAMRVRKDIIGNLQSGENYEEFKKTKETVVVPIDNVINSNTTIRDIHGKEYRLSNRCRGIFQNPMFICFLCPRK